MKTINEKIVEILRRHPDGGERFFDALDLMVRGDKDILEDFLRWVANYYGSIEPDIVVVLTGSFGRVIASNAGKWLRTSFGGIVIVNGGIRSGRPVELPITHADTDRFILLDDSYYSGKTKEAIERAIKEIRPTAKIEKTFVVYDGSKVRDPDVLGIFRYYDRKETT